MMGIVAFLVLAAWPVSAQTPAGGATKPKPATAASHAPASKGGDLSAIYKRSQELYAARNYPAALAEAQKYESAVKARLGTAHPAYGTALNQLGIVYHGQGKYGEAEEFYKRALAIREKATGGAQTDLAQLAATVNGLG